MIYKHPLNQLFDKYQKAGLLLGLGLILLGSFLPWQCIGSFDIWFCEDGVGISLLTASALSLSQNGGLILSIFGCFVVWLNLSSPNQKHKFRIVTKFFSFLLVLVTASYFWHVIRQINFYNDHVPELLDYSNAKLGSGVPLSLLGSMLILFVNFLKNSSNR